MLQLMTTTPLTPGEFAAKMREIMSRRGKHDGKYDPEEAHILADKLLCEVLRSLGYGEGVAVFEICKKYYG